MCRSTGSVARRTLRTPNTFVSKIARAWASVASSSAEQSVAAVVRHHIYPVEPLDRASHGVLDRGLVPDVHVECEPTAVELLSQVREKVAAASPA
jgi:hypothetical protein